MTISVTDPFNAVRDPSLPSLSLALDPIEAKRQIKRIVRSFIGPSDRVRLRAIRVMRHKPGKRCLLEYDLTVMKPDGAVERITLIGKVRARRFGAADYRLNRALWQAGFDDYSPDDISVPQPVGVAPKLRMWLQRKVRGRPATKLLAAPGGDQLARRIAEAAHKVHCAPVRTGRCHTMTDELRILHQCLDAVVKHEPSWRARIDRLWDGCTRFGTGVPQPVPTGIHRDFYADQVIVAGQRLYILDLDLYCYGDPALDIGNFIGHITEQSLRMLGNPFALAHLERAMEDRFVEFAGEATRHAVRAYTALTLARHVYLSIRFPERRHLTERLLELCELRLGLVSDQPAMLINDGEAP